MSFPGAALMRKVQVHIAFFIYNTYIISGPVSLTSWVFQTWKILVVLSSNLKKKNYKLEFFKQDYDFIDNAEGFNFINIGF